MTTNSTNAVEADVIPGDAYSRRVIGLLYQVHNALDPGYQEKYYQRAFEQQLKEAGIPHTREQYCPILFKGQKIGSYYIDFVVGGSLVVELKVSNEVHRHYLKQVLGYLEYTELKLELIACFGTEKVTIKRVIH